VHRAHQAGLAGASVLRGIEGYGASNHIHTTRILSLSEDLPVAIVIVDDEDRVRAFLPQLDELTPACSSPRPWPAESQCTSTSSPASISALISR